MVPNLQNPQTHYKIKTVPLRWGLHLPKAQRQSKAHIATGEVYLSVLNS